MKKGVRQDDGTIGIDSLKARVGPVAKRLRGVDALGSQVPQPFPRPIDYTVLSSFDAEEDSPASYCMNSGAKIRMLGN